MNSYTFQFSGKAAHCFYSADCLRYLEIRRDWEEELRSGLTTLTQHPLFASTAMGEKARLGPSLHLGPPTNNMTLHFKFDGSTLQGDSRGPLTFKKNRQHGLIGVVSLSGDVVGPENDGRYARISYIRQWIEGAMSNVTFCGGVADASPRRKFGKRQKKNKKRKGNSGRNPTNDSD